MSHTPAKVAFQKPWLSHADQVRLLQSRGLTVCDPEAAEQFLAHVNYYRFSGYGLAFEVKRHEFASGATFEQVAAAYAFDAALRDLLTEALEVVEIDFRTAIAVTIGERHGPLGHIDPANFRSKFDHAAWTKRVCEEAERSSEVFVDHFRERYQEFPNLPVWSAPEVMSFGCLSRMFQGMDREDQRAVAARYDLQPADILVSWMHHLVYVRNVCAHHSRLWDRTWTVKPKLPPGKKWAPPLLPGNKKLFVTLLALRHLMAHIPAMSDFATDWRKRIEARMASPPETANSLGRMGLTADWREHPVWADAGRTPPQPR